jgi:hypothetical protein
MPRLEPDRQVHAPEDCTLNLPPVQVYTHRVFEALPAPPFPANTLAFIFPIRPNLQRIVEYDIYQVIYAQMDQ